MDLRSIDPIPSISQIVRVCRVCSRTAERWRAGQSVPWSAWRLLELESRGRVMPDSWPERWRFNHRGFLELETTHPALIPQQLTWYHWITRAWPESLQAIERIRKDLDYLSLKLPCAEIVELERLRAELASITADEPARDCA